MNMCIVEVVNMCIVEVEAGHCREMREGGTEQSSPGRRDSRAFKVQACDARVERQRTRQDSTTSLLEVSFAPYFELCECRVAALDALQQLRRQVRVLVWGAAACAG